MKYFCPLCGSHHVENYTIFDVGGPTASGWKCFTCDRHIVPGSGDFDIQNELRLFSRTKGGFKGGTFVVTNGDSKLSLGRVIHATVENIRPIAIDYTTGCVSYEQYSPEFLAIVRTLDPFNRCYGWEAVLKVSDKRYKMKFVSAAERKTGKELLGMTGSEIVLTSFLNQDRGMQWYESQLWKPVEKE